LVAQRQLSLPRRFAPRWSLSVLYVIALIANSPHNNRYSYEGTRPESDIDADNDFVAMMKAQASKRGGLLHTLKKEATEGKLGGKERDKLKGRGKKGVGYWQQMEAKNAQGQLPKIPKKSLRVTSGSMLDGSWLHSFDKSMKTHFKALAK